MTELIPGRPCVIWEEIRDFTRDGGFILPDHCPMEKYCNKKDCTFNPPTPEEEKELAELRSELKTIQNEPRVRGK